MKRNERNRRLYEMECRRSGKIRRQWGDGRRERSISWKAEFVFIFMASSKIVLTSKRLELCQANVTI
jgi:hypothetical protein